MNDVQDMVPRSRLAAMERELAEAAERLAKVQKDAGAEIERLQGLLNVVTPCRCHQRVPTTIPSTGTPS